MEGTTMSRCLAHPIAIVVLGLSLAFAGPAISASPAWTSIGPPVPAIEGPVAVDPSTGTIYVGTFGGGVLKSTDRGATFATVNNGLTGTSQAVTSIAMDPVNPDIVVVGSGDGGIHRTLDGGATWLPTSEVGTNVVFVTVDPFDTRLWYAGYAIGNAASIIKSVDRGATWTTSDAGIPATTIWSIVADPVHPGVLYAGSGDAGAFKSTDGGASWRPLSIQPIVWCLAIDPTRPDVVYAGVNGDGVFKSTDAGATFTRVGSPDAGVVLALAVDPTAPDRVWAGTISGGLAVSEDGGATWTATSVRSGNVLSLAVTVDGDVFAGTGVDGVLTNAPLETPDAGGSFRAHGRGKPFRPLASAELAAINAQNVVSVTVDPRESTRLLLGTNDGGLLESHDDGRSWKVAGKGFLSRASRKAVFDSGPPRRILVGSFNGGGLFISTNDGAAWTRHLFGSPAVYVWTSAVDPETGAIYAGTRGEGLWRSTDDGGSFARIDGGTMPQVRTIAFDAARPGRVLVGGNKGIWRSSDGGATFAKVAAAFTLSLSIDPSDPDVVYAATQTLGVYKSTDGGQSFAASNDGLTFMRMSRSGVVAIDPSNPSTLYASTEGGGVFKSRDAGATWAPVNDGLGDLTVFGLTLDAGQPNVLYAAGPHGVYRTETGAETTSVLQPASMSGKVRWYGGAPVPSATVSCQRQSATVAADGSYSLSGLHSGEEDATVEYSSVTDKGEMVTEQLLQRVTIRPGANTVDFWVY
jgi:photosystem II stability/assembly factor-like uncharacterized protein